MRPRIQMAGLAGLVITSLALAACSSGSSTGSAGSAGSTSGGTPAAGGAGTELVVTSFGGDWEKAFIEAVVKPFEAETGAKVRLVTAYSADALTQLTAAKAKPQFDVVHFSGGQETKAAADGLLAKMSESDLANAADLANVAKSGLAGGEGPVVQISPMGIMYRTDKITTAPTSWKDVLKPEYSKHVALTDLSNSYGLYSLLGVNSALGGDLTNIKPGMDALTGLAKSGNAIVIKTSAEMQQAFSARDIWIAPYSQDYAETLRKASLPVEFVVPSEGATASFITANLVANRPNTELAKKFINAELKPEAQAKLAAALLYSPTNTKTVVPAELATKVLSGDKLDTLTRYPSDTINTNRAAWTTLWNQGIAR